MATDDEKNKKNVVNVYLNREYFSLTLEYGDDDTKPPITVHGLTTSDTFQLLEAKFLDCMKHIDDDDYKKIIEDFEKTTEMHGNLKIVLETE